jgi:hypothetical protein
MAGGSGAFDIDPDSASVDQCSMNMSCRNDYCILHFRVDMDTPQKSSPEELGRKKSFHRVEGVKAIEVGQPSS